ncbi:MAG: FHA domain-containing protein [Sandaracinaceae bacterium]|nr:FHA domain-containing protein [Sandaracinaceae bacterium]
MFKLVISDDEGKQTVVPLVRDEITIGRKEGNTIRLTERNVSRRHARLAKANGKFLVEDLHSYNGVKVNGQRIGAETSLEPGDQITIGDYHLALQVEGAETTSVDQHAPGVTQVDTAMIAAPGPPPRLVMITPPAPGAEFSLTSDRVRIGRAEDLDIWINHRSISREHAEIQKEPDGNLRLIDLGSANGVRVNGEDVQNALLTAGDVVELGQVRFRFVAAGEHYAFDADRTVQMDAVTAEPEEGGSRAPIFVAIAIVLLAVVGAVLVAFWGGGSGDTEPVVTPLDSVNRGGSTGSDPFAFELGRCTDALRTDDLTLAVQAATAALALRPGDPTASDCLRRAQEREGLEQLFAAGQRLLENGNAQGAYDQFMSLPADSPLRNRPQVGQAARAVAVADLGIAQQALEQGDCDQALQTARRVAAMLGLTEPQRVQATRLLADAQACNTGDAAVVTDEPPGGGRRRGRGGDPAGTPGTGRRRGGEEAGSTGTTGQTTGTTGQTTGTTGQTTATPAEDQRDYEAEALACTRAGDNQCVIRLLSPTGRTRTPRGLALLIEAYRAQGQTRQAVSAMELFVRRYPNDPRAGGYRQILQMQR